MCSVRDMRLLLVFFTFVIHSTHLCAVASEHKADNVSTKTRFTELNPQSTGVGFVHPIDISHPKKYLYVAGYASAGVAIGDVNGDGLQDIFFAGGPVPSRLYLQAADANGKPSMKFRDATDATKLSGGPAWSAGTAMVDTSGSSDAMSKLLLVMRVRRR